MQAFSDRVCRVLRSREVLAAVVVVLCVGVAADALGCPTCKDAVNTADPEGLNVARGYFYSILLMLAMPFTLVGSFGIYVWREMRRQRLSTPQQPVVQPLAADRLGIPHSPTAASP